MEGKVKALMRYSCCTASLVLCTLVLIPPNTYLQFKFRGASGANGAGGGGS